MSATWQLGEREEQRPKRSPVLYRSVAADYKLSSNGQPATDGMTLSGFFAVYDKWTQISSAVEGNFYEKIQRGAFKKSIRERGNRIPVMFSHGHDPVLGLQVLGRVRDIGEDANGVRYEVDLFDGLPQLLLEGLRAGAYGASFRAKLVKDRYTARPGRSEHNPTGLPESVVTELALSEFGPVAQPAYRDTSAEIRSVTDQYAPRVHMGGYAEGQAAPRSPGGSSVAKPQRALPEPLPSWHLGSEPSEPYWLLNRKEHRGLTPAREN
jgi:HK97 family phage prohead protease